MKKSIIVRFSLMAMMVLFLISIPFKGVCAAPVKQQIYEIKIYRVSQKAQEDRVDSFLKDAYLPALHRAGIDKVGVFKPVESDTAFGKLIYVFIPFKSIDQFLELPGLLEKDLVYTLAGKDFLNAPYNNPPYARHESILLKAFMNMPQFVAPNYSTPTSSRIYELRSYESATEAKGVKKIQMFNQGGEIKLFERLGFNPVFFGEVLVGSHKPNLMYMITFSDMASHDEHWATFRADPEWKKLSSLEEYKNTVSKPNPYLLHPASYSDF